MKERKFLLTDLFEIKTTKGIDKTRITFANDGEYDFIGRTTENYGVQGALHKLSFDANPKDTFSLIQIGETAALWREKEWYASQNIFLLIPKTQEIKNTFLYVQTAINKVMKRYGKSYNVYPTMESLNDTYILLPVFDEANDKNYTVDDIDWNYMQEKIQKFEQKHISKLDAYLKATGLNDYKLTEDDKHILASKLKNEDEKESELLPEGRWWKEGREFAIAELFDVVTPKKKFNANSLKISDNPEDGHPYVARGSANNGIRGYIKADEEYLNDGKTISFGQDTATVFWQEEPYFTGDKIKVLKPKFDCSTEIAMYVITAISKSFSNFSWGSQSFKVEVIKDRQICLPIQTDDSGNPVIDASKTYSSKGYIPDWEYMEKYIKATEKEVIKEVVLYKDEMLKKIKEITGEKGETEKGVA